MEELIQCLEGICRLSSSFWSGCMTISTSSMRPASCYDPLVFQLFDEINEHVLNVFFSSANSAIRSPLMQVENSALRLE